MNTKTANTFLDIFHTRYEDCDDFIDNLLLEFECYCNNYIHPPIWHCTFGHHFCSECRTANDGCPTCKKTPETPGTTPHQLQVYQSKVLESFHEKMYFPCKYYLQGCDHRMKAVEIDMHQLHCGYQDVVVTQYVDPRYEALTPEEYQEVYGVRKEVSVEEKEEAALGHDDKVEVEVSLAEETPNKRRKLIHTNII